MTLVTISSKNQITIPVEYLRALGLKPGKRFLVDKKNDELSLKPVRGSIVDELAGSLEKFIPEDRKAISVEDAIKLGKLAMAKHDG